MILSPGAVLFTNKVNGNITMVKHKRITESVFQMFCFFRSDGYLVPRREVVAQLLLLLPELLNGFWKVVISKPDDVL
jgi:hypothetical protein